MQKNKTMNVLQAKSNIEEINLLNEELESLEYTLSLKKKSVKNLKKDTVQFIEELENRIKKVKNNFNSDTKNKIITGFLQ